MTGLKIRFRKECRFDSDHPHHLTSNYPKPVSVAGLSAQQWGSRRLSEDALATLVAYSLHIDNDGAV